MIKRLLIGLLAAAMLPVVGIAAGPTRTQVTATKAVTTDALTNELSPIDHVRATQWGLSALEWRRYEALMTGIRGSISPATISPIEVLGIHARDEAERTRYAERWAKLMRADAERILAFQRAYDEAGRRLFPNQLLIANAERTERDAARGAFDVQDRVLLFTAPDCGACDQVLGTLLGRMAQFAGIDIYLSQISETDPAGVRGWAAAHGISPDLVKQGRVTLNFDAGTLKKLGRDQVSLPVVLLRRGTEISNLSASTLQ